MLYMCVHVTLRHARKSATGIYSIGMYNEYMYPTVQYNCTTTNPVSCSYIIQLNKNIHTHTRCMRFYHYVFFFYIEPRAHIYMLQCHSITNGSRPPPRLRRERRRGETWATAATVWNYLPPPQAEYTSYIMCVVCVFQAQGLCGCGDQTYREWKERARHANSAECTKPLPCAREFFHGVISRFLISDRYTYE